MAGSKRELSENETTPPVRQHKKAKKYTNLLKSTEFSYKNQRNHCLLFKDVPNNSYAETAVVESGSNKEKVDKLKNKRFFFTYSSGPTVEKNKTLFHGISHDLSVALAVICGKFYRLVLGKGHPRTYLGFETTSKDAKPNRISEEVFEIKNCDKVENYLGTVLLTLISYIFKEDDYEGSNVFYNEAPNGKGRIVKIDSEYGFYSNFAEEKEKEIHEHLQYLYSPWANPFVKPEIPATKQRNQSESELQKDITSDESDLDSFDPCALMNMNELETYFDLEKQQSPQLVEEFISYSEDSSEEDLSSDEEYEKSLESLPKFFRNLFLYSFYKEEGYFKKTFNNDAARREEIRVGLCLFLRHDKERYGKIIDKVLDSVESFDSIPIEDRKGFKSLDQYKESFKKRFFRVYESVKTFAINLPEFNQYIKDEEYENTEVYKAYFPESELISTYTRSV